MVLNIRYVQRWRTIWLRARWKQLMMWCSELLLKDHPSVKKIKDFWEDSLSQWMKWWCKKCATIELLSVFCSPLKISCFRIVYLDMRIYLWQTGRILKKTIMYVIRVFLYLQIYNLSIEFFIYLIISYVLQRYFSSLKFESVLPAYSPASGPVSLLHFWRKIPDLRTLQLDWERPRG